MKPALRHVSLLVAASVFLLSSVKSPDKARNTIVRELQHEETNQRINAILRFSLFALCAGLFFLPALLVCQYDTFKTNMKPALTALKYCL